MKRRITCKLVGVTTPIIIMAQGVQGFDKTGKSHKEGIDNEKVVIKFLKKSGLASDQITHKGGTKNKADAVDPLFNNDWTIKRKKDIRKGSFDWINTSKVDHVVGDTFDDFISQVKKYRNLPESHRGSISFVKGVRKEFNNLTSSVLDGFTSEDLSYFIQNRLVNENKDLKSVVTDVATNSYYIWNVNAHPAVKFLDLKYKPFLKGRAKGSRRLLFTDGIKEYNCGLRIRVTSNNGITAFLGLSKANRNSQVVFKLQQDKVSKLLTEVNATVYKA
tara:strand:+ start:62 stop:886 length:825 start_codon:yes stop_codon:yes gene_type:complete